MDPLSWNRKRYTLWAPFYDLAVRPFTHARRRSIQLLGAAPGARVLVVGAGTGEDLPLLPAALEVLAVDLTPAMLSRARVKARPGQRLEVMDGHALALDDASFDAVLLHLILAVIPDPALCLAEAARVTRAGGTVMVLDKFVGPGAGPSMMRRALNVITSALFTDITRSFENILASSGAPLVVEHSEPALRGLFRIVKLRRT